MFEQLVESSSAKKGNGRWAFFAITALLWVCGLSGVIVAGVFAYDARLNDRFEELARIVLPLPQAPKVVAPQSESPRSAVQPSHPGRFVAVEKIPDGIGKPSATPPVISALGADGPARDSMGGGGLIGGPNAAGPGVIGAIPVGNDALEPPPPVIEKKRGERAPPVVEKKVAISKGVIQGSAIRRPLPIYPALARAAGVSGVVVVEVVVDESGDVAAARALSGHALLREAAVKAAWGWKWNPTLLSEVPVRVVGTITFNFTR